MNIRNLGTVTINNHSKSYQGYTLFAPMSGCQVWLIDMMGQVVHNWDVENEPGAHGMLLSNSNLLYSGKRKDSPVHFGGLGGELLEIDWDGNLIWKYEDLFMHHDFQRLSNGNTMILRWVPTPENIASRVIGGVAGTEAEGVMWSDSFQEISPNGDIVWEWLGFEHLDPEIDSICPLCPRSEWTHTNSCCVLPGGDILTSFLTLNTIAIINKITGDIAWRWSSGELAHQHNPSILDNGHILVFDNGSHRPASPKVPGGMVSFSRVLELDPKKNVLTWEYVDEVKLRFFSSFISGCQRLPNGNTLICEGTSGRIFEITYEKEIVWEFTNEIFLNDPFLGKNNAIFRAHRYGIEYSGLVGKI